MSSRHGGVLINQPIDRRIHQPRHVLPVHAYQFAVGVIEITESGCGYLDGPDETQNGRIPDGRRIQWYREELAELARAIADGARVRAFHAWTLLDNFQWAEGYTERYGLIYTDFRNQKRTIKDSGLWYGRVAAPNRLDV